MLMEPLLKKINARLKSSRPADRRIAAILIGKARLFDWIPKLIYLLREDPDKSVREMAAYALDLLSAPTSIPSLIAALYDDAFGVRSGAGWALVHLSERFTPQLVVPDVIEVLCDQDYPHAQEMAYLVLSRIPDDAAADAIQQYWR